MIRQGDQSRDLWVVLEGQCEVVRRLKPEENPANDGESLVLAALEPFHTFRRNVVLPPGAALGRRAGRSPLQLFRSRTPIMPT